MRVDMYVSSCAPQYAARPQASLQMLVYMCLLPAASLEGKVMVTNVLASSLAVCQKQMIQGSVSSGSYEAPQSFMP